MRNDIEFEQRKKFMREADEIRRGEFRREFEATMFEDFKREIERDFDCEPGEV